MYSKKTQFIEAFVFCRCPPVGHAKEINMYQLFYIYIYIYILFFFSARAVVSLTRGPGFETKPLSLCPLRTALFLITKFVGEVLKLLVPWLLTYTHIHLTTKLFIPLVNSFLVCIIDNSEMKGGMVQLGSLFNTLKCKLYIILHSQET